ncbi:unnamed protein product [Rhizoctonia solani]|uniref:Uncharacterized protein n=1 Tax=Rhizoctonia solani TaxID=456999 RepID=A0A8H3DZH2_9AGAM|nr:unnamed protein product [Rhizoctonia solani]
MSSHQGLRPLVGDDHGHYKIAIVGNSGTGKSTLSAHLAELLNLPTLSLDHVHWNPGWVETPKDDFKDQVQQFMDAHPDGWVIDGNYMSHIGPIVQDAATDILWLDPPLLLNFWRIMLRTFGRMLGYTPQCAPGCDESLTSVFASSDSILLWCLTHHHVQRTRNIPKWERQCAEKGEGKWRRFDGWGSSLDAWLAWLNEDIKSA